MEVAQLQLRITFIAVQKKEAFCPQACSLAGKGEGEFAEKKPSRIADSFLFTYKTFYMRSCEPRKGE